MTAYLSFLHVLYYVAHLFLKVVGSGYEHDD